MNEHKFTGDDLLKLKTFSGDSKFSGGQVMIVGGSKLFHGAPLLALRGASRIASMVFFASPEEDKEVVYKIKAGLGSFIWIPMEEAENYASKVDSILIGPGMMRSHMRENNFVCDEEGEKTRRITLNLIQKFPEKKWIVDGGSLQVLKLSELPKGVGITPNKKEFLMLFGEELKESLEDRKRQLVKWSKQTGLIILSKDAVSLVANGEEIIVIEGGSNGMIKGGVGDVLAGVAVGLAAKDELIVALSAASYLTKKAGESLERENGLMFSSDDLVNEVPKAWNKSSRKL